MRSLAAGLLATFVLSGLAAAGSAGGSQCFFSRDFENWKAPDAKTIYIRVNLHDYYRLDLTGSCPALLEPGSHLVTTWHGSTSVCSAVDWDLKVADAPGGIVEPCIVKTMTKLSPSEAEAIPRKFKP